MAFYLAPYAQLSPYVIGRLKPSGLVDVHLHDEFRTGLKITLSTTSNLVMHGKSIVTPRAELSLVVPRLMG